MSIIENENSAMAQAIAQSTIIDETTQSVSEREKKVMEEKVDLRIQRTYKLLTDALVAMLSEQQFEDISVRELCQRAMVRPATFYKHFGDKYELFTFVIKELQRQFHRDNAVEYDPKRPQTYYAGMIDQTFCFVDQNKAMVTSVIKGGSSHILLSILSEQIEADVLREFREDEKRGAILPGKPALLTPLFTGALIYLVKWWVMHDLEMPKEAVVSEYVNLLRML